MRPGWLFILAVALFLSSLSFSPPSHAQADEPDDARVVRWIGLGDSYSAGEGLPEVSIGSPLGRECQRALTTDDEVGSPPRPSAAWAPLAALALDEELAYEVDFDFVACTGAITDDVFDFGQHPLAIGQHGEALGGRGAEAADDFKWDVVSFSMGGNNLDFDGIIKDCIGADGAGVRDVTLGGTLTWTLAPWVGCGFSEQDVKSRIDRFTEVASVTDFSCADPSPLSDTDGRSEANGDEGTVTLPEFYEYVGRCLVADGGTVVVMGYPQVIEESSRWGLAATVGGRCHRIRSSDHGKLRAIAAHLNYRTQQTVEWANTRFPNVRFEFIDPVHFFEGGVLDGTEPTYAQREDPRNRHALCGGGEDWLNGVTVGTEGDGAGRLARSFHPNQRGQTQMANAVSIRIDALIETGALDHIAPGDRAARPSPGVDAGSDVSPVMLVVDVSGSMAETDDNGRVKLEAAKLSILDFLGGAEQDIPIGLRTYPNASAGSCAPGSLRFNVKPRDPTEMGAVIRDLRPDGDTPTAEALLAAADDVRAAGYRNATLVLVSDGESTCEPPCEAAQEIVASGLDLQVISVGFNISDMGREELDCVAQATNGIYLDVSDTSELQEVMSDVSRPDLALGITYPDRIVPVGGFGSDGNVIVTATIENLAQIEARNVVARFSFTGESPGLVGPVRALGNLLPGASRSIEWSFRPGVALSGSQIPFQVSVSADNDLALTRAEGAVTVTDVRTDATLGPLLNDRRLAILGDSYSAGEGAEDYLAGTDDADNGCHRSQNTYLMEMLDLPPSHLLACSGAVVHDVHYPNAANSVPSQLQQLYDLQVSQGPLDGVVMTLGGNDAGFVKIAATCVFSPRSCAESIDGIGSDVFIDERITTGGPDSYVSRLVATYQRVSDVLNAPLEVERRGGVAPVMVLAYPRPLPSHDRACGVLSPVINSGEIQFLTALVTRINGHIEAAIIAARQLGIPVVFVDLTEDAFLPDHTVCDRSPYARSPETINVSTPDFTGSYLELALNPNKAIVTRTLAAAIGSGERSIQELFHPNADGYDAESIEIARWSVGSGAEELESALQSKGPVTPYRPFESNGTPAVVKVGLDESLRVEAGSVLRVQGGGFAPGLPVEVVVRSTPRVLALVDADPAGSIDADVVVPLDLAPGQHSLQLVGIDGNGEVLDLRSTVDVAANRGLRIELPLIAMFVSMAVLGTFLLARSRRPAGN